jgi:hypothetical protein
MAEDEATEWKPPQAYGCASAGPDVQADSPTPESADWRSLGGRPKKRNLKPKLGIFAAEFLLIDIRAFARLAFDIAETRGNGARMTTFWTGRAFETLFILTTFAGQK